MHKKFVNHIIKYAHYYIYILYYSIYLLQYEIFIKVINISFHLHLLKCNVLYRKIIRMEEIKIA